MSWSMWKVSHLYLPFGQFVHHPPPSTLSAMSGMTTIIGSPAVVFSASASPARGLLGVALDRPAGRSAAGAVQQVEDRVARPRVLGVVARQQDPDVGRA